MTDPQPIIPEAQPQPKVLVQVMINPDDTLTVASQLPTPTEVAHVLAKGLDAVIGQLRKDDAERVSKIVVPGSIPGGVGFLRNRLGIGKNGRKRR